jgi:hypothetical protein
VAQVGWVLDYLDDIASDMSVFHRVDDIGEMDGPTFFKIAYRLSAYAGVMAARHMAEREEQPHAAVAAPATYAAPQQDINPGTRATLMADPAFQGVFSFG